MDAFKLLTRGAKFKANPGLRKQTSASQLPSTGEAATPQLFSASHDARATSPDTGVGRGIKRKRGSEPSKSATDDIATLDFFGTATSTQTIENEDDGGIKPENAEIQNEGGTKDIPMTEAERKAALKAHKIKITDLRTHVLEEVKTPSKKAKKTKKKRKTEEKPAELTRKQRKAAQRLYPEPLTTFPQLRARYRISRRLAENISQQGYTVPTEVQLGSLPLLLGGATGIRDQNGEESAPRFQPEQEPNLLVVAPTGSGKTLSFMIPLIDKIIRHRHQDPESRGIFGVVLAPTKELVAQIVNEGRKLTAGTGVKISAMRKGTRVVEDRGNDGRAGDESSGEEDEGTDNEADDAGETGPPKKGKRSGAIPVTKSHILVSTPLVLANALSDDRNKELSSLPSVENLILDEADVLLDPLFREQTLDVWNACTNLQLKAGLWSATMGSNIEELTKNKIQERQDSLGIKGEPFLIRLVVGLKDSAVPNISHKLVYAATEQGKLLGLRQLLHPTGANTTETTRLRPPFLVFTQTISRAIALHSELMYDIPPEAGGSSRIAVLHSELTDSKRSDVMAGFRKGEIWILITTDLLARGVDFRGINGVVNYDIPNSSAGYVHRVGRTGRAGREGGVAVTFYTKEDIPYVKNIANVISASEKLRGGTASEGERIPKWLLDSLPNLSKKDKQDLKKHGVRARRPGLASAGAAAAATEDDAKGKKNMRISTKSGFERRMENKRRGAIEGSRRRKEMGLSEKNEGNGDSWGGIED